MSFTYVVHNAHAWVTLKNNLLTYLLTYLIFFANSKRRVNGAK